MNFKTWMQPKRIFSFLSKWFHFYYLFIYLFCRCCRLASILATISRSVAYRRNELEAVCNPLGAGADRAMMQMQMTRCSVVLLKTRPRLKQLAAPSPVPVRAPSQVSTGLASCITRFLPLLTPELTGLHLHLFKYSTHTHFVVLLLSSSIIDSALLCFSWRWARTTYIELAT